EKWVTGFRKTSCSNNNLKRDGDSKKSHHALAQVCCDRQPWPDSCSSPPPDKNSAERTPFSPSGCQPCDAITTIACQFGDRRVPMSLQWPARSPSLAWSNPVARWWGLLTLVSGANIAAWFLLRYRLQAGSAGLDRTPGSDLMLLLCAAYVF